MRLVVSFLLTSLGVTLSLANTLDGVTFAGKQGSVYVLLRPAASALGITVDYDSQTQMVELNGKRFKESEFRTLFDGTKIIPVRDFEELGATIEFDEAKNIATLTRQGNSLTVVLGQKKVEVSISEQRLRAWQGEILVMETNISSGKPGHSTPRGSFKAGPAKSAMHYSRLYNNAPMPWSVQINGHVFIHGYRSVPRYPASHGCIRMPIKRGNNAAKYFYEWVDLGTPVHVKSDFSEVSEATIFRK